ncbi:uncharacterized protein MONBRDRAFT_34063 [Monosiga brevicollis MX1]|uniref:BZIP domain-containing protein n=1 Tax=Monosiga brevicollis TaxID=81824 RepID=A9V993_MONBE|nr:uncharacterized protein MONBRDRAFT_34063 [Monosiga brevicollis MX1]EDQ85890.1 predicted protein [Monosiga brevicollis MX1]|eukprot:XP_001749369.1 hypothetical protein [Monosiga brevicollis MX1]
MALPPNSSNGTPLPVSTTSSFGPSMALGVSLASLGPNSVGAGQAGSMGSVNATPYMYQPMMQMPTPFFAPQAQGQMPFIPGFNPFMAMMSHEMLQSPAMMAYMANLSSTAMMNPTRSMANGPMATSFESMGGQRQPSLASLAVPSTSQASQEQSIDANGGARLEGDVTDRKMRFERNRLKSIQYRQMKKKELSDMKQSTRQLFEDLSHTYARALEASNVTPKHEGATDADLDRAQQLKKLLNDLSKADHAWLSAPYSAPYTRPALQTSKEFLPENFDSLPPRQKQAVSRERNRLNSAYYRKEKKKEHAAYEAMLERLMSLQQPLEACRKLMGLEHAPAVQTPRSPSQRLLAQESDRNSSRGSASDSRTTSRVSTAFDAPHHDSPALPVHSSGKRGSNAASKSKHCEAKVMDEQTAEDTAQDTPSPSPKRSKRPAKA